MKKITVTLLFLLITSSSCVNKKQETSKKMDNLLLEKILKENTNTLMGQIGYWEASIDNIKILIVTDEAHNRMRIISPISNIDELSTTTLKESLEANFHTALDVKYAISNEVMWSTFIHPLKELSEHQVKDALKQVVMSVSTFGKTYTSTDLVFPGNAKSTTKEI